jgi:inosine-uridine nucleoside N-ribohydrolase
MPVKLLLDTDIGSDIDDAVCLAYLLAHPDCELLGITTVTGDVDARARLASALCTVAGKSIPIYPGHAEPLRGVQRQPHAPQAAALDRWPHATDFPQGQAIEFLRHTIHAAPGEITLLAIGPMTNVAALFAADPAIPALLKSLVLMCGVFTEHAANGPEQEWNAMLDPVAAAITYAAGSPIHRSIGLDVTTQVKLPAATVREHFQTPLLRPVLDFAEVWFQSVDQITFHDPLAAATIFEPTVCGFSRGQVIVEPDRDDLAGKTLWTPDPAGPHEVALTVDAERFFTHFFGICSPDTTINNE